MTAYVPAVALALQDNEGLYLIASRPHPKVMSGYWEFPGGKIQEHETPEQALMREVREELNINVQIDNLQPVTFSSVRYDHGHVLLLLYLCQSWQGRVRPMEGQEIAWSSLRELKQNTLLLPASQAFLAFLETMNNK